MGWGEGERWGPNEIKGLVKLLCSPGQSESSDTGQLVLLWTPKQCAFRNHAPLSWRALPLPLVLLRSGRVVGPCKD